MNLLLSVKPLLSVSSFNGLGHLQIFDAGLARYQSHNSGGSSVRCTVINIERGAETTALLLAGYSESPGASGAMSPNDAKNHRHHEDNRDRCLTGDSSGSMEKGSMAFLSKSPLASNSNPIANATRAKAEEIDARIWMKVLKDELHHKPLDCIAMPGSHDSGSYSCNYNEFGIGSFSPVPKIPCIMGFSEQWSISQQNNIYEQLLNGARYVDIRVCVGGDGEIHTEHTVIGELFSTLLNDVKRFLSEFGESELVILHIAGFRGEFKDVHHKRVFDLIKSTFTNLNDIAVTCSEERKQPFGELKKRGRQLMIVYEGAYGEDSTRVCDLVPVHGLACAEWSPWYNSTTNCTLHEHILSDFKHESNAGSSIRGEMHLKKQGGYPFITSPANNKLKIMQTILSPAPMTTVKAALLSLCCCCLAPCANEQSTPTSLLSMARTCNAGTLELLEEKIGKDAFVYIVLIDNIGDALDLVQAIVKRNKKRIVSLKNPLTDRSDSTELENREKNAKATHMI
jgi:hypothetical protein